MIRSTVCLVFASWILSVFPQATLPGTIQVHSMIVKNKDPNEPFTTCISLTDTDAFNPLFATEIAYDISLHVTVAEEVSNEPEAEGEFSEYLSANGTVGILPNDNPLIFKFHVETDNLLPVGYDAFPTHNADAALIVNESHVTIGELPIDPSATQNVFSHYSLDSSLAPMIFSHHSVNGRLTVQIGLFTEPYLEIDGEQLYRVWETTVHIPCSLSVPMSWSHTPYHGTWGLHPYLSAYPNFISDQSLHVPTGSMDEVPFDISADCSLTNPNTNRLVIPSLSQASPSLEASLLGDLGILRGKWTASSPLDIHLYSPTGQLIRTHTLGRTLPDGVEEKFKLRIGESDLPPGIYMVVLRTKGNPPVYVRLLQR